MVACDLKSDGGVNGPIKTMMEMFRVIPLHKVLSVFSTSVTIIIGSSQDRGVNEGLLARW